MSIESKLEQVDRDIEALLANKEELKKQLEAEKKPKLRHLDYGLDEDGAVRIMISTDGELRSASTVSLSECGEHCDICSRLHIKLGNLNDDLKAMQEDVEEFEMRNSVGYDLRFELDDSEGEIRFVPSNGYAYRLDLPTFRNKVNQMYATLKRKEQK